MEKLWKILADKRITVNDTLYVPEEEYLVEPLDNDYEEGIDDLLEKYINGKF